MMRTQVGFLSQEDLMRLRQVSAKENGYKVHPEGYSAAEIEANEMRLFQLCGEFLSSYNIDSSQEWHISNHDGRIWYQET